MELSSFMQFEEGTSTRRVKSRSKACLHCRRRKMRCDGVKPSCFQCIRAERGSECEYDDGITKTGTQMLYERLAMLEKRFRDLQAQKRNGQTRHPRSSAGANANMNTIRSISVSDRVYSRPGVNGSNVYGQAASRTSVIKSDMEQSYLFNNEGLGTPGPMYGMVPVEHSVMQSPHLQPFDAGIVPFTSHSSPCSTCSTPSLTDLSNDSMSHSKYNFSDSIESRVAKQEVYVASNVGTTAPSPSPMHTNSIIGNLKMPCSLLPDVSDISSLDLDGEVPQIVIEHLIDTFIAHSQQAGLTFLSSCLADMSCKFTGAPLSSMTYSMLLWGAHFSPMKALNARKEFFLQRALASLPSQLSAPLAVAPEYEYAASNLASVTEGISVAANRYNILAAIAASTMLATYFYAEGRALEGSYHATTASQLAICAGLHHTPDPRIWRTDRAGFDLTCEAAGQMPSDSQPARSNTDLLPPPTSEAHALERHHLFWNAFVLDRAWSAAGRLPMSSSRWNAYPRDISGSGQVLKDKDPRTAIETPWPEDTDSLSFDNGAGNRPGPSLVPSRAPVEEFINGLDLRPTHSILQLRAKSAALFEAASHVAAYRPIEQYESSFLSLQRTLSSFLKTLVPIPGPDFRAPSLAKCAPYTINTLVHAAIIRLHLGIARRIPERGYIKRPNGVSHYLATDTHACIVNGLLGYERVFSQNDMTEDPADEYGAAGMPFAAMDQCLSSAREIVRIAGHVSSDDFAFLEPIIASCWALAAEVLFFKLERCSTDPHQPAERANLLSEIHVLENSLKYLGTVFPIGKIEAHKLESALTKLTTARMPPIQA